MKSLWTNHIITFRISKRLTGGSRTAATSKMECFVIIILDVAAVLDPPLRLFTKFLSPAEWIPMTIKIRAHICTIKKRLLIQIPFYGGYNHSNWKSTVAHAKFLALTFSCFFFKVLGLLKRSLDENNVRHKNLLLTPFAEFAQNSFSFYLGFLSRTLTIHKTAGKWEAISLILLHHFHLLHRLLDISQAITAESSPLHQASSRVLVSERRSLTTKLRALLYE